MSRYPQPELKDLPEDIRARMLEVQEKAGFIPNVFLTLAHRPDEFRAFFAYHDSLILRESGLQRTRREERVAEGGLQGGGLYNVSLEQVIGWNPDTIVKSYPYLVPPKTEAELADLLFEQLGLNKREAKDMVEHFFEEIRIALERGDSVKLSGFGNFQLRDKPQRPGRNPKTGEEIPITARRVVTFHASQKLKAMVEAANHAGTLPR